jgi:CHAT domain-containing protein
MKMKILLIFLVFFPLHIYSQTMNEKLSLVKNLIEKGNYSEAIIQSKKAIENLSINENEWKPEFLRLCGNSFVNNSDSSIFYYSLSYNELQNQKRKYSIESLKALNNISSTLRSKNPERAVKTLKEAIEISDSIGCNEYPFCLYYYSNASYIFLDIEDPIESLKYAKMGEDFAVRHNDQSSNNYISFLSTQSQCYKSIGNYPEAVDLANKVYRLRKASDSTTAFYHQNLANSLKTLGDICQKSNLLDCENYYLSALDEYEQAVGYNHPYYIQTLRNLAFYEFQKGDTLNASDDYALQLDLAFKSTELSIKEKYSAAISYCGFLQQIKKFDESLKYLSGLINDMEQNNMFGRDYLVALFTEANNYSGLKNYKKSIEVNLKIIEILQNKNSNEFDPNDLIVAIHNLSNQYLFIGDTSIAEKYMKQKIDYQINEYIKLSKSLNRLQTVGFKSHIEDDVYSIFSYVYDTKRFNTPFGKYILEKVLGIKNMFNVNKNELVEATFDLTNLHSKLPVSTKYCEIIQIPYYPFNKRQFGYRITYFIINVDSKSITVDSINIMSEHEDYIPYYQKEISSQSNSINSHLYNIIWKPIAEKIGDAKTIYVSLGGVYNNINLNTLYNPETGKYLIEEKDIRIVNSARDFVLNKERDKKQYTSTNSALYGFPDFNGNTTKTVDSIDFLASTRDLDQMWIDSLTRGGMKASSLPATKVEVEQIAGTFQKNGWSVKTYTGEIASETNIKQEESPRVLHVATHGYFFEDIPMDESNDLFLGMDRQRVVQDPMLRSGLLFTGANKTLQGEEAKGENGLLSAAEASLLDLRETELVVLSACETGKGEVKNSEGVYGLRKAFADAGAQNIVMSLWKVDDKVTQEFMTRFYEIWLNEKTSIREAFNRTQLEIKAKYAQPYYWGAFILVGE